MTLHLAAQADGRAGAGGQVQVGARRPSSTWISRSSRISFGGRRRRAPRSGRTARRRPARAGRPGRPARSAGGLHRRGPPARLPTGGADRRGVRLGQHRAGRARPAARVPSAAAGACRGAASGRPKAFRMESVTGVPPSRREKTGSPSFFGRPLRHLRQSGVPTARGCRGSVPDRADPRPERAVRYHPRPGPAASPQHAGGYATTRRISSSEVRPRATLAQPSSRSVVMPCSRASRRDLVGRRARDGQPLDLLASPSSPRAAPAGPCSRSWSRRVQPTGRNSSAAARPSASGKPQPAQLVRVGV